MSIPEATFGDATPSDLPAESTTTTTESTPGAGSPPPAEFSTSVDNDSPQFAEPPQDEGFEETADDLSGGDDATDVDPGAGWFTEDLQQRVTAYGMSPEQALKFGNADALSQAFAFYDQQAYQAGQALQQQQQQWQQYYANTQAYHQQPQQYPQQQVPPGQSPQQPQQQTSPQAGNGWKYNLNLKPEDYGEEIVNAFQGMNDQIQQISAAQQQVAALLAQSRAQYEQQVQQQQYQQYWNEVQSGVKDLGEGYEDLFGKDVSQLTPNSPQYQNWHRLNDAMQTIITGYQAKGMRVPSYKALVKNAVAFSFPHFLETRAKQQVTSKIKERQRGFTARPSNAPSRPMSGEEAAARKIDAFRAAAGVDDYSNFEL